MDWRASLTVAISVAFVAHVLASWRNANARRRDAATKFRGAVLAALPGLYPLPALWPNDVDGALRDSFPAIQTAVAEFRPSLPWWRRRSYDRAWFRYRSGTQREIDVQNYHHYLEFRDNPDARENFRRNVSALLAFGA